VYLEKSPKWSPYDVSLSMSLMGRHFEEFYINPRMCGHGTPTLSRTKVMNESVNVGNSLMYG
jgi:hypothetical protein